MRVLAKVSAWQLSAAARAGKRSPPSAPRPVAVETAWGAFLTWGHLGRSERDSNSPQTERGRGPSARLLASFMCSATQSPLSRFRVRLRVNEAALKVLRLLCTCTNTTVFNGSCLMCVFCSHSLPMEREILQLRERPGRKQPGDSNAAASHVQNQVYWPHHCG